MWKLLVVKNMRLARDMSLVKSMTHARGMSQGKSKATEDTKKVANQITGNQMKERRFSSTRGKRRMLKRGPLVSNVGNPDTWPENVQQGYQSMITTRTK